MTQTPKGRHEWVISHIGTYRPLLRDWYYADEFWIP